MMMKGAWLRWHGVKDAAGLQAEGFLGREVSARDVRRALDPVCWLLCTMPLAHAAPGSVRRQGQGDLTGKGGETMAETKKKQPSYPRFADYSDEPFPTDLKIPVTDLLDRDLIIWDAQEREGDYGPYLVVLCSEVDDQETRFTTAVGGKVVVRKIQEAKLENRLPLVGCITKPDRYYDIL